jgi:hypothetical protein
VLGKPVGKQLHHLVDCGETNFLISHIGISHIGVLMGGGLQTAHAVAARASDFLATTAIPSRSDAKSTSSAWRPTFNHRPSHYIQPTLHVFKGAA